MKKILFLLLFLIATPVLAHQPRIISENFTEIKNPEVSQAFYGELKGESVNYQIKSDNPFNLYVGLLVPDIEGIDKDISAEVYQEEELLFSLDGEAYEWESYFEEFGGDNYFKGPDKKIELIGSGTYIIRVYSPDNLGKYVLVVGDKEEFPLPEIINTLKTLPKLKADFFEKSPLLAFYNFVGLFLLGFVIIVVVLVVLIYWAIKKIKKYLKK